MSKQNLAFILLVFVATSAYSQRARSAAIAPKPVIFAVLNNGTSLEPIAYLEKGKLLEAVDGASEPDILKAFHRSYYKPKASYRLIFGGADAGTAVVKSSDPQAECAKANADVSVTSARAKLRGMVMGLATNARLAKPGSGTRRLPTPAERREIEELVRAEFTKQKVLQNGQKVLKYHNLTAIDIDNDGTAELVGTFWAEPSRTTRALLFFIAGKDEAGRYRFGHSAFQNVKQEDTMSEDITAVDSGVYHELLLDSFDVDGDGSLEIFTYVQSFEGAGFNAYSRKGGKWTRVFEGNYYRCAF